MPLTRYTLKGHYYLSVQSPMSAPPLAPEIEQEAEPPSESRGREGSASSGWGSGLKFTEEAHLGVSWGVLRGRCIVVVGAGLETCCIGPAA